MPAVPALIGGRPNTPAGPSRRAAGSDLLFGVLALRTDFISRRALIAETGAWPRSWSSSSRWSGSTSPRAGHPT